MKSLRSRVLNYIKSKEDNYVALHDKDTKEERSSKETMTTRSEHSPSSKEKQFRFLGIIMAISAALLISVVALFVKLVKTIPIFEIVFIRSTLQSVFCLPAMVFWKDQFFHPWKRTIFLILRGLTGLAASSLSFYSVQHMPLGDARVITLTSPVYAAFLGWIFLKETVSSLDVIAMVLSLGGVVLIGRPSFIFGSSGESSTYGNVLLPTIVALISAIFAAISVVLARSLTQEVSPGVVVFYFSIVGTVISPLVSMISGGFKYPDCGTYDVYYAILTGVLAYLAQILLTKACQLEKASVVALLRTTGMFFSFILEIIFLHVIPDGLSIGGAILILLCNGVIFFKKMQNHKREQEKTPLLK